jgi:hypothetical protein
MHSVAIKFHYKVDARIWYMKHRFFLFPEGNITQNWTKMKKLSCKLWCCFVLKWLSVVWDDIHLYMLYKTVTSQTNPCGM